MKTDLEIASEATLVPVAEAAAKMGLPAEGVTERLAGVAKVTWPTLRDCGAKAAAEAGAGKIERNSSLVLVTGVHPTAFGEGKTVTTIGLAQALCRSGRRACAAVREPSMGPVFGLKGGAAGGGYSQVLPMEAINLHFTGDLHAVTAAHNLLSAMLDAHVHHGNALGLDPQRVTWPRVVDANDRALRDVVVGLGGHANGRPREDRFDITAASEVMAILALATSYDDLKARLGRIVVGEDARREPVTAKMLEADGAMALLLRDALLPNLVSTVEGDPALVHCGPFANIAHGNSSVAADLVGLACQDYVVTESGFGSDMGAEKFMHIKASASGVAPDCAVIACTVRAMKLHGGAFGPSANGQKPSAEAVATKDVGAVTRGASANLARHVKNMLQFGVPVVVAVNRFPADHDEEVAELVRCAEEAGADAKVSMVHAKGGEGGRELAEAVADACARHKAAGRPFTPLFAADAPVADKAEAIVTKVYGGEGIEISSAAAADLRKIQRWGYGTLPVCMAKTQYSFSSEPDRLGAPGGFKVPIARFRLNAGAGFVVAICGGVMTMPGLPKVPAAVNMDIDSDGTLVGVFG